MTVAHSALTGTDLHEPKGAATAVSGSTYVSNGSGSGSFAKIQGWGQYQDTARTVGTPTQNIATGVRTKFLCDGGFLTEEYLPSDAGGTSLWNVSTDKHVPIAAYDTYDFRVSFTAENYAGSTPYITVELDIGGSIGVILSQTYGLLKAGAAHDVIFSFPVFTGTTYLANGGTVYLTYTGTGTCDIYKNSVLLVRSSRIN